MRKQTTRKEQTPPTGRKSTLTHCPDCGTVRRGPSLPVAGEVKIVRACCTRKEEN